LILPSEFITMSRLLPRSLPSHSPIHEPLIGWPSWGVTAVEIRQAATAVQRAFFTVKRIVITSPAQRSDETITVPSFPASQAIPKIMKGMGNFRIPKSYSPKRGQLSYGLNGSFRSEARPCGRQPLHS